MRVLPLLFLLIAIPAAARMPDGSLGMLQTPNNGRPVMLTPGESFTAFVDKSAALTLVDKTKRVPLSVETVPGLEEAPFVIVTVPADVAPGRYALEARTERETDVNKNAVFVLAEPLNTYYVSAHLGAITAPISEATIAGLNNSDAAFVLVSGVGPEVGYAALLTSLNAITLPVFLAPPAGMQDRAAFHRYFGPIQQSFNAGDDAWLGFSLGDTGASIGIMPDGNRLYPIRRVDRARRWSIGWTDFYAPFNGMRAQWTLFTDDPLDYLFTTTGKPQTQETKDIATVPWGETKLVQTPPDTLRIVDVTEAGLKFRPTTQPVANTDTPEAE